MTDGGGGEKREVGWEVQKDIRCILVDCIHMYYARKLCQGRWWTTMKRAVYIVNCY